MLNLCVTCGKYRPLVPGFTYLWNEYAGLPIEILETGDVESWCADIAKRIKGGPDKQILLMLEDYWLTQPIIREQLDKLEAKVVGGAHKADLEGQVAYFKHTVDGEYVVAEPAACYRTSLQAAIWDRDFLLSKLANATNPWSFELQDNDYDGSVLVGMPTRTMSYANIMLKGAPMWYEVDKIKEYNVMKQLSLLPPDIIAVRKQ
jgi:hypothetical protein